MKTFYICSVDSDLYILTPNIRVYFKPKDLGTRYIVCLQHFKCIYKIGYFEVNLTQLDLN